MNNQTPSMTPTLQRFAAVVQRKLEVRGWTVTVTWGEGYFTHLTHVECTHDDQHHGWGLLLPEIAWRETYQALVQPLEGEIDWFELWTQCEQGEVADFEENDQPEPQEEQPSLYQRWYEGGDIYELAKEYGVTLHEAYRHITTESQHARAMSVADIMSPDFLDAVRDALETSDNPNQLLQRMQELERWKKLSEEVAETKGEADPVIQVAAASFAEKIGCSERVASLALSDRGQEAISLHINEADLTEEQLSVLLYLVVDATYWVKL